MEGKNISQPPAPTINEPAKRLWRLRLPVQRLESERLDELGRERGYAAMRVVNALLVLIYLSFGFYPLDVSTGYPNWLLALGGFIAISVLLLLLVLQATTPSTVRRLAGNIGDITAISYVMLATGELGVPLFVLYLSTTLASGFRFGLNAMVLSAALSLAGFATVVALSPVWQALPVTVPVAVVLSLILLPAYATHLVNLLAKATKRAEEASAAKGRFLARMSHELRTPLAGILGTAELLGQSKRLTRDDRSLLDVIRGSVKVSMRQIDNVLDFSKIEAGKLTIEQSNFDLHALLNRAARLVRATAIEKSLRLTLRIDPHIPYQLVGDPHHLDEVLLNLLSNAVKFTENGYVSLEARLLQSTEASALVRLEVHDTGIGIEPRAMTRIFEAFTQEDGGTKRLYGGTGLGTTIAKQLVELMGGQLRVESTKGKGSRFYADIPFQRQTSDSRSVGSGLSGLQALLVSKAPEFTERFAFVRDDWDVSLTTVPSPAEAVIALARGIRLGNPFDVILADSHAVIANGGRHGAGDFIKKACLSSTPVFLVCDVCPDESALRDWGYAAVLSYSVACPTLYNALRSSNANEIETDRGVLRIEPWAWRQQDGGRPRPRLLIADDNRTNLMILERILESAGYEVDTAKNGDEALEKLTNGRYKVAVIDMHMPGLDGVDVIKQYRAMNNGARTPIVMLTVNATINAKLESAEAGADAYLTKPATSGVVLSTIKKLLEDREICELKGERAGDAAPHDFPIVDVEVLGELARLYRAPEELRRLLVTFDAEGNRLLRELSVAVSKKNHAAFLDLIHAFKGNSANVGALRLSRACMEAEGASLLDIYRDGAGLISRLEHAFAEASRALRDYTGNGAQEPAEG